jgi:RimJ/RimL family protein N-acetyltransferase
MRKGRGQSSRAWTATCAFRAAASGWSRRGQAALIGEVGLADIKRYITPSLAGMPDYGLIIMTAAKGRGHASEALRAAFDRGEEKFRRATLC